MKKDNKETKLAEKRNSEPVKKENVIEIKNLCKKYKI